MTRTALLTYRSPLASAAPRVLGIPILELAIEHLEEVTLFVRRHEGNMTRGKTMAELNPLLLFKKALDRQRAAQPPGDEEL